MVLDNGPEVTPPSDGMAASGGMAAWNLTRKGVNVLVLDAGTRFPRGAFWTHVKPWDWWRKIDHGERPPQITLDPKDQPYETPEDRPFDLAQGRRRRRPRLASASARARISV